MAVTVNNPLVRGPEMVMLSHIQDPDVSLAVWDRSPPRTLLEGMAGLCPAHLPQGRVLAWLPDVPVALSGILAETPIGATMLGQLLVDDILMLVKRFAAIASTDIVDIRLDRLRHDACWKFHRDQVSLRLLTTYRGPATQIVPQTHAEEALRNQRAYRGPLEGLPDGAVALFKGIQAGPDTGVVHRSPPIAGTGTVRSLLCLNLPSDTSPRLWEP
jgi:hypothetical protein